VALDPDVDVAGPGREPPVQADNAVAPARQPARVRRTSREGVRAAALPADDGEAGWAMWARFRRCSLVLVMPPILPRRNDATVCGVAGSTMAARRSGKRSPVRSKLRRARRFRC
jgi:hypothetical protein